MHSSVRDAQIFQHHLLKLKRFSVIRFLWLLFYKFALCLCQIHATTSKTDQQTHLILPASTVLLKGIKYIPGTSTRASDAPPNTEACANLSVRFYWACLCLLTSSQNNKSRLICLKLSEHKMTCWSKKDWTALERGHITGEQTHTPLKHFSTI